MLFTTSALKRFLLIASCVMALAGYANATTYYVSLHGNDSYSGLSTTSAWKTINHGDAAGILKAGDTVIVEAGTYPQSSANGVVLANCSGTSASLLITYRANGKVIIDQSAYSGTSYGFFVSVGMRYVVIDGFEIKGCQWGVYFDGSSWDTSCYCHHNTVKNCIIHDMHYGDASGGAWASWCAGIYNSASQYTTIQNNIIYNIGTASLDSWPSTELWALCVMSPWGKGIKVYNNTFANAWAGIHAWESGNSIVRNNIFYNIWKFALSIQASQTITNTCNLFYSTYATYTNYSGNVSAGAGEIDADPMFLSAQTRNYSLLPDSPAIDAGTNVGLPYAGTKPDIGAIESNYGETSYDEYSNIYELRTKDIGSKVLLTTPKVATAASTTYSDGSYYIEDTTRVSGIKVIPSSNLPSVALGDRICPEGVISSDSNGEPVIYMTSIESQSSGEELKPLGMKCGDVASPIGLDPAGLLVRVTGRVTYKGAYGEYLYIQDGSATTTDASGNKGLRIEFSDLATPLLNEPVADQYISITGIAGAIQYGTSTIKVLRPRSDSDCDIISTNAIPTAERAASQWIDDNFSSTGSRRPFSFTYNGNSSADILANWTITSAKTALDSNRTQHTITFTDPNSGLQLRCVSVEYADFPAVEWTLYFKNTGTSDTPIIENIQPLDADIYGNASGDFTLYYADGSSALATDFQPRTAALTSGTSLALSNTGGRSSDGVLPFFNIAKPDGTGIAMGIGWTGQWAANFSRDTNSTVNLKAGMELTHFVLHAGEEVRSPAILMLFWDGGDRMGGNNQLRRLLLSHYSPTPNGQPVETPICAASAVAFESITETGMVNAINNLHNNSTQVQCWWIDAGWYKCINQNWVYTGTWDPDPDRFPNGLKPVGDAAHNYGLKFLLWFEPERVMQGTWIYINHPEWLLSPPSNMPSAMMYMYYDHFYLFDLANTTAYNWMKNKISSAISDYGVDIYRNDCNIYPLYYWRSCDTTNRQGIKEIQYVTALYKLWDDLLAEHPGLIIDNCASGGRRLDFEMLRRSLALWRSDYCWDAPATQNMTYGLSQWVPITGLGSDSLDVYEARSGMGCHYSFALDWISTQSTSFWTAANSIAAQVTATKDLFKGDFYPLTAYSTATNVWVAWQYDRYDIGKGILQVFRRPNNTNASMTFKFRGLAPTARYKVTYSDISDYYVIKTGTQLMENGLVFSLMAGGSGYVTYEIQ